MCDTLTDDAPPSPTGHRHSPARLTWQPTRYTSSLTNLQTLSHPTPGPRLGRRGTHRQCSGAWGQASFELRLVETARLAGVDQGIQTFCPTYMHDDSETEDNVVNESEVEWLDTEDDEA